jgi:subtilisin-like proprotein convertase family protein
MKKFIISSVLLVAIAGISMGQNVGIGTTNPTAQLHTTGTVRHAVLTGQGIRPVFADANGNLLTTLPPLPSSSVTNSTPQAIPDFNCTGVTSLNNLAGLPASIQSAGIKITINITHPKLSDLSIYLSAPDGSIINLTAPSAALTGANFSNTVFTDAGALLTSGSAPFTGSFKPLANMSPSICGITPTVATFTAIGGGNLNPNGNWTLRVIDNTAGNTGNLTSWTVFVNPGLGIDGVWSLKGNAGTNAYNFIGTTDNTPLRFRVRNINSGFIDSATNNTAIGYRALDSLTTGTHNVAFGNNALKRIKTSSYNVALGVSAHERHLSGDNNTVVGAYALYFNQSTGRDNTVIGTAAMLNSTTGSYNTAIGSSTLVQNQPGSYNTAVGYQALYGINANSSVAVGAGALGQSTQASYLVAVGDSALYNNTGSLNTAVGSKALFSNTGGSNNTAQGFHALYSNIDGNWNTALGTSAMGANTSGFNNTTVGSYSLLNNTTGNQNAALGSDALHENKGGSLNTALGLAAMYNNTSGNNNAATGYNAMVSNTTGSSNTANGHQALFTNATGNSNTAIGVGALYKNTSVSNLVAIGDSALFNTGFNPANGTDGTKNTGIGSRAMFNNSNGQNNTAAGYHVLFNNTSGSSNTAVGINSLNTITTGSFNTAIGAGADVFNGGFSNATAIGAGAIAPGSNSIQLGNNSVANIYSNNNSNMWVGNLYEKGNGIVRNTSNLQLKMSQGSYVVNSNIGALSTIQIPFSFNETFSTVPVVYVGNITGGPGGFAEIIMSVANVTTTGGSLFVSNPRNVLVAPNFTVNIVAIGGE